MASTDLDTGDLKAAMVRQETGYQEFYFLAGLSKYSQKAGAD